MWWCIVDLPNGTQQAVKLDTKAIGQECLEKVCKALGIICEMEYFGLEPWTHNQKETRFRQWYNLRNRLHSDSSSSGIPLMLALRVKFWVPVHNILQQSVRNLFYMQARSDLLDGRLCAHDWSNAAKLAALLCQADGLRFNEQSLRAECPMRMRQQQQALQQQQQQQQHKLEQQRKEKEHVLSFKKRRLSKQKSVEHIECVTLSAPTTSIAINNSPSISNNNNNISINNINSLQASPSTSVSASASSSSSPSNSSSSHSGLDERLSSNPLRIYMEYVIQPSGEPSEPPADFLRQIAVEHSKLAKLPMSPKSAKYWLLREIQELSGYGEELFSGVTTNESAARCDIAVGAHGITVIRGEEKESIPFSAIAAAKSLRRIFKLEYVDDHNDRKELEIKLAKHPIAASLYRSITERHAFYVCDKVRCVVTNQFTRDLKGTIASMFNEDTELGKRYVFDIQHTCREVHDQARRKLHERGGDVAAMASAIDDDDGSGVGSGVGCEPGCDGLDVMIGGEHNADALLMLNGGGGGGSMAGKIDLAIRDKEAREAAIERCVDTRISEAMQCKICMDRAINTVFNPCCHVIACAQCAARCSNCPNCRVKISSVVKIYLPPELRTSQTVASTTSCSIVGHSADSQQLQLSAEHYEQLDQIDGIASTSSAAAAAAAVGVGVVGGTAAAAAASMAATPPGVAPKAA
ncbi:E3 ubiquitin-protein ligase MYLIP [Drosophila albomicans]|uniref:RING-type E3 ubiquitin transferase n=1 Tax=Drosophila albomicans TaxID=7291 RepID=A0A6P8XGG0_DROAB|nr:E3 ubiquitin-protein ligase MYLIP [Drosophila albomicans]